MSMCDGTDDPNANQTGTTQPKSEPTGTTLAELGQPNQVRQPSRTGTAQPSGTAQAELGQPSRLGRPTQTWSGPIFSPLLSDVEGSVAMIHSMGSEFPQNERDGRWWGVRCSLAPPLGS